MKIEAMLWIVVLILVALAFLFPKTRSFSLSAIGVAIVAVVVIVVIAKRGEPVHWGLRRRRPLSKSRLISSVFISRIWIKQIRRQKTVYASRKFDSIKYAPRLERNAAVSARLWRDFTTTRRLTHSPTTATILWCRTASEPSVRRSSTNMDYPPRRCRPTKHSTWRLQSEMEIRAMRHRSKYSELRISCSRLPPRAPNPQAAQNPLTSI